MLKITIDHRESRSPVYAELHKNPNLEIVVRELACGDYVVHDTMAIERKSASDFALSVVDRRIFAQVLRLKDEFNQVVFMIEGDIHATRSGLPPDALRGALSYLIAIEGVSVLMVRDTLESAAMITTLARHMQEGLGYVPPLRGDKPKNELDLARYLVEGLPGIGPKTAADLIKHFGSPLAIFEASAATLAGCSGVGKKTAERIYASLRAGALPPA